MGVISRVKLSGISKDDGRIVHYLTDINGRLDCTDVDSLFVRLGCQYLRFEVHYLYHDTEQADLKPIGTS